MQKVHLIRLHLTISGGCWNSLFISPIQQGNICTLPFVSHKAGLVQDKLLALIRGIGSILTSTPTHVPSTVLSMKGTIALEGMQLLAALEELRLHSIITRSIVLQVNKSRKNYLQSYISHFIGPNCHFSADRQFHLHIVWQHCTILTHSDISVSNQCFPQ